MKIFNSLGSNYDLGFTIKALLSSNSNDYSLKLKSYLEKKYQGQAILVYKGREAIELALMSLGLPQGTVVAFNGLTCYAVYKAVRNAGCVAEYIDIEDLGLNFSPKSLKEKLKENPAIKVLIIQNTLGYPCEIEEITEICKQNNVILIEDLAHSIGAKYKNEQEAGTVGDFTILSFSQDKMVDSVSGGALIIRNKKYQSADSLQFKSVTTKQKITDRLYPLFTFIIRTTYKYYVGKIIHSTLKKINLLSQPMSNKDDGLHNLSDWYCNLTYMQFKQLEKNLAHRKRIASIYSNYLSPKILSPIIVEQISNSSNLRFPIFISNRPSLIKYLKTIGVFVSDIWHDAPIAPKRYMRLTNYKNQCPNSEKVASKILNLPTHKNISGKDAKEIAEKINLWLKSQ